MNQFFDHFNGANDSDNDEENDVGDVDEEEEPPRRHRYLPRINYYRACNDRQFRARFRLNKRGFLALLNRIRPLIEHPGNRHWAVPPSVQLLVVLRLYATGSFLIVIGDFVGLSKRTVWGILHRVSAIIASLRPEIIRFPSTPEEIRLSQAKFFTKAAMPCVIGALDCKLVRVQSFGGNNAELYRGRKGYFAINVQAICNADLEFIDIVARWPGSTHDSTIFNNSRIAADFENGQYPDAVLVGDGGYPNRSFLLTPLANPVTPEETLYNESQIRTRNPIERSFGIWSKVFYILSGSRFHTVQRILTIIVAAAVLHNIRLRMRPFHGINANIEAYTRIHDNPRLRFNEDVREQLINGYFQGL